MMNYYNMKNRKDAPEEADLCKKRCIKKVSIPEEYYLTAGIFSLYLSEFIADPFYS